MSLNLYRVIVTPIIDAITCGQVRVYVAAEFTGCAVSKVQRVCSDRYHFRPSRANADIRVVRVGESSFHHHPDALVSALKLAQEMGETGVVKALAEGLKATASPSAALDELLGVDSSPGGDAQCASDGGQTLGGGLTVTGAYLTAEQADVKLRAALSML